MSASWITKLQSSESRIHKEDVLKQAHEAAILGSTNSSFFLEMLQWCYDPFITYGVKQIPVTVGIYGAENPWHEFKSLLTDLSNRTVTGTKAKDRILAVAERFDSTEWNTFLAPVLRRDMRCGISTSTINKVFKDTQLEIPTFECQLATNCEGRPEMRGRKRLEPKLDGVRVLAIVKMDGTTTPTIDVTCYSRNGKVFENFTVIEDQIKANMTGFLKAMKNFGPKMDYGFVLDGEVVGNSFQELMRQARRKTDAQADDSVFHVFDVIPISDFLNKSWNAPLHKRLALLKSFEPTFDKMPNLELLPHIEVDLDTPEGVAQLLSYSQEMVELGFEGIMIKDLDAPYECTRSTAWMKWKPVITVDLQFVGAQEGTGKHEGKLGAIDCAGEDQGKEISVSCGSGFDDQFRAQIWADITGRPVTWEKKVKKVWVTMTEIPSGINHIGRTVEIMADAVTQNRDGTYSLRFPRFVRFRDDK